MKKYISYVTLLLSTTIMAAFVSGCTSTGNGRYLIYSIKTTSGNYDDTIGNYLKVKLQGQRYDISFHENYAKLVSSQTKQEFILAKETNRTRYPTYTLNISKADTTYRMSLLKDTTLRLSVTINIRTGTWAPGVSVNASLGGPPHKGGAVDCMLSKVDE